MKKKITFFVNFVITCIVALSFLTSKVSAQGEEVVKRPVTNTFESGMLIENPTIENPRKGGIQLIINHRFGTLQNGWEDVWGIYAPSNIYMGVNYGIFDKLSVGFASEKNNKLQEFHLKWNILEQHRSNGNPVSVAYYGNISIDARKKEFFGTEHDFVKRLSYFSQLIFSRKFSDKLSLQFAPSYTHFNSVDTIYKHDVLGLSFGGKFTLWNMNSFILDYSYPMPINAFDDSDNEPKPNLGMGVEFVTGTHVFQVFITNFDQLVSQKNYLYNQHEFNKEGILFGFNILVRMN